MKYKNSFVVTNDLIASNWLRLANYIIDQLIQYGLIFVLSFIIAFTASLAGNYAVAEWLRDISALEEYLIGIIIMLMYYNAMETPLSRSVGKLITGTIVVMEDGSKPDGLTILKRSLCRLIPFDALSFFGYRGWHDSIPEVYVVKKAEFEEALNLFDSFEEIGRKEEE